MPRRLANGLTLLSAVVCVGSAMWVGRSWFRADSVGVPMGQKHTCGVVTLDGQVMLWDVRALGGEGFAHSSVSAAEARSETFDEVWEGLRGIRWLGLGWGTLPVWILILPLWLLPLLTAIAPVRWWRKRRREAGRGFAVAVAGVGE